MFIEQPLQQLGLTKSGNRLNNRTLKLNTKRNKP